MLCGVCMSFTTEEKSRVVEDGGTGPYKAVMKEEASLAAHTVFVPQDQSSYGVMVPAPTRPGSTTSS